MFKTNFDMRFGVRRIENTAVCNVNTCVETPSIPDFGGLPVIVSKLCVVTVHKAKKWKRLNRPDKVKVNSYDKPTIYMAKRPLVQRDMIICHPDMIKILDNARDK
jgi:hypothetical protein